MTKPEHFFIVGAQRSGTTFLYTLLDQHPEICMNRPVRPEPRFLLDHDISSRAAREQYYQTCFAHRTSENLLGEKSTSYIECADISERILRFDPKAKALMILRNPVKRALSNYRFSKQHGVETRSLAEVFLEKKEAPVLERKISVSPFAYLERGRYADYIRPFFQAFPKEQLHILVLEDLVNSETSSKKELFDFLGVENIEGEKLGDKINASPPESVSSEVEAALATYYKSHNDELSKLLGRSLHCWNTIS